MTTNNFTLNQPAYGSQSPTWDQPLNANASLIDQALSYTTPLTVTGGITVIPSPSTSASSSGTTNISTNSQCMRFNVTGTLTSNATILLPYNASASPTASGIAGMWVITNNTTGSYTLSVGVSNSSGTAAAGNTVVVTQGSSNSANLIVYSDGVNVYSANSIAGGVSSFSAGSTGLTPNSSTTGAVTLAGTLSAANGGTGLTSPGASGNVLTSNGTTWVSSAGGGSSGVSSFSVGTTGFTTGGVTTGPLTLAGTLVAANGGTGLSSAGTSGNVLTSNGSTWTSSPHVASFSVGTTGLTTGGATTGSLTLAGLLVAANGGTGLSTPGTSGNVLTSNGTTWVSQAPTFSGTLAVANGGTGQTTYTNGQLLIGNTTGNTLTKATLTAASGVSITNGTGSISIGMSGSYTGTFTASTGLTATTGNITATAGSVAAGTNIYVNATSGNVGVNVLASTGSVSYLGLTGTSSIWQNTITTGTQASIYYDATATPANGTYYFNPAGVNGVLKLSTAAFTSATTNYANSTSWTLISDQSQKTDVVNKSPQESSQRIFSLRPVDFTWIKTGKRDAGFIAQDFEQVYPANVTEYFDDQIQQNIKAITINMNFYSDLVAVIQDLQKKVETLEAKLA